MLVAVVGNGTMGHGIAQAFATEVTTYSLKDAARLLLEEPTKPSRNSSTEALRKERWRLV